MTLVFQNAIRKLKSKAFGFRPSGRHSPCMGGLLVRPVGQGPSNLGRKNMGFGNTLVWVHVPVQQLSMVLALLTFVK